MIKMATMPIYGKNLKNLLRHKKADDLESWYAASDLQVLPKLFKWWPWLDLDLFYVIVKFGPLCFVWEKGKTMDFSETIVVYNIKVSSAKLNEYINLYDLEWSKVTQIQHFQTFLRSR